MSKKRKRGPDPAWWPKRTRKEAKPQQDTKKDPKAVEGKPGALVEQGIFKDDPVPENLTARIVRPDPVTCEHTWMVHSEGRAKCSLCGAESHGFRPDKKIDDKPKSSPSPDPETTELPVGGSPGGNGPIEVVTCKHDWVPRPDGPSTCSVCGMTAAPTTCDHKWMASAMDGKEFCPRCGILRERLKATPEDEKIDRTMGKGPPLPEGFVDNWKRSLWHFAQIQAIHDEIKDREIGDPNTTPPLADRVGSVEKQLEVIHQMRLVDVRFEEETDKSIDEIETQISDLKKATRHTAIDSLANRVVAIERKTTDGLSPRIAKLESIDKQEENPANDAIDKILEDLSATTAKLSKRCDELEHLNRFQVERNVRDRKRFEALESTQAQVPEAISRHADEIYQLGQRIDEIKKTLAEGVAGTAMILGVENEKLEKRLEKFMVDTTARTSAHNYRLEKLDELFNKMEIRIDVLAAKRKNPMYDKPKKPE